MREPLGPRAGQKVITWGSNRSFEAPPAHDGCANEQGVSRHAAVRCAINQRHQLEPLCRYISRPAIANERLSLNSAGDVVLQLKTPYRNRTTHIVMSPLDKIAGSDFEQPKVGPKGGGQDSRSNLCNTWRL